MIVAPEGATVEVGESTTKDDGWSVVLESIGDF